MTTLDNNKRGKGYYTKDFGLSDTYKHYVKNGGTLKYTAYRDVYEMYIKNVIFHIVEQSADFSLPSRLGSIGVRKKKIKMFLNDDGELEYRNRKPDWKRTIDLWETRYGTRDREKLKEIEGKPLVFHDNKHSNGYTFFISWDKRFSNVKNQSKYIFIPTRDFSRAITKIQKKNKNIDYYESTGYH